MTDAGSVTRREIESQPGVWASTLDEMRFRRGELAAVWTKKKYDNVIFTGCGSTYYLSLSSAAILAQLTGKPCRGVPASELLLYPDNYYPATGRTLLIAVSRSGATTETLHAVQEFVAHDRGEVLTFSCYPDQPLAQLGSENFVLVDAQEESVVQTRAFSSLYLSTLVAAFTWSGRNDLLEQAERIPEVGQLLLNEHLFKAAQIGAAADQVDNFFFLGSGPQYGLACEASLKMKEMSLSPSEAFHFLELRHGPKSIITPSMMIVGLFSARHSRIEKEVISEAKEYGAQTLTLGIDDSDFALASDLDETVRGLLFLPPLQWLAAERAASCGIDPDHPKNLDTVVQLDLPS